MGFQVRNLLFHWGPMFMVPCYFSGMTRKIKTLMIRIAPPSSAKSSNPHGDGLLFQRCTIRNSPLSVLVANKSPPKKIPLLIRQPWPQKLNQACHGLFEETSLAVCARKLVKAREIIENLGFQLEFSMSIAQSNIWNLNDMSFFRALYIYIYIYL